MEFLKHPDEIVRKCKEKLADPDNLSPNEMRELKSKLETNKVKQNYYEVRDKALQEGGVSAWLSF